MSGPSGTQLPPPPPPPPDGAWTPPTTASVQAGGTFAGRFDSASMSGHGPWRMIGYVGQGLGLLAVFLGTVVVIAFGSTPVNCIGATSCAQGTLQGVANAVVLGHLLWAFGLFGLASGAGLQLYLGHPPSPSPSPEETRIYLARRRGEFVLLLASTGLLFLLMLASAFGVFAIA